jgi:alpha-D-xyloside xylohydrolase
MVTRRQMLTLAGSAPALLSATPAAAQTQGQLPSEEHEYVQKMSSFEKVRNGVVFRCATTQGKNVDLTLTVCTPQVLRVQMCPDAELKNVKGLLEIKEDWPSCAFDVSEKPEAVTVDTGALRVEFQRDPWKYVVYDKGGQIVLQEHVRDLDSQGTYRALPIGFTTAEGKFRRSNETFYLTPGENFYGFGERFTRLNKLGQRVDGWHVNPWGVGTELVYKDIPFFMSTKGYGIFVNTTFRTTSQMGSHSLMSYTVMINDPRLDYFILYGPSMKEVLARYEEITGWPVLPPKKSFGIWYGAYAARTVDAAVKMARWFRDSGVPVDFFQLLNLPLGPGRTGAELLAWTKDVSAKVGEFGIKAGIYTYPMLALGSEMEQEARAKGYVLMKKDGSPYEAYINGAGSTKREYSLEAVERTDAWRERFYRENRGLALFPDFTNPAAVKWWKDKIGEHMKEGCWAVAMADFGEDIPLDAYYYNKRSGLEMHNLYSLLCNKATFEGVAENSQDHRGLINGRSGTAGMQRYPICWSGDPNCEWEDFATCMRAGLSIGLSGVPFWATDTAGYAGEPVGHPTPELLMRWSQWEMFQSHVRLHSAGSRGLFTYGEKTVDNFRKYAKLRYRLLPYVYSHAYNATKTGLPMMRAMVLEFQDDPRTYDLDDQYMFGDAFLVAPMYTPTNKRTVYLPAGKWYYYHTGKEYTGPQTLQIETPLEELPLYVRSNCIIPMGPDMAYIGEKPFDPITLDIWLASEAACTLYDDDESAHTEETVPCRAEKAKGTITLTVGVSGKTFVAKFNKASRPAKVTLNGTSLPRLTSQAELEKADRGWYFDPSSVVYAKFNGHGSRSTLMLQ